MHGRTGQGRSLIETANAEEPLKQSLQMPLRNSLPARSSGDRQGSRWKLYNPGPELENRLCTRLLVGSDDTSSCIVYPQFKSRITQAITCTAAASKKTQTCRNRALPRQCWAESIQSHACQSVTTSS
mmetsp:Transcript_119757/g.284531  ORF Transcript_119757/g.284531 Transcript_119757/m.284531 type:complete len:127 (-) Transcript_119757:1181-1561(-)